ncbi:MAG: S1 RNA-binding domain-containing protein, partial [Deltaproteobacteria bacterium]
QVLEGVVRRITDFGAFVEIFPGTEGLLHVSEMDHKRIENPSDAMKEGDIIDVKVLTVDEGTGKIRLSRRAVMPLPEGEEGLRAKERMDRSHAEGPPPSRGGDRGGRPGDRGGDRRPRR